MEQQTIEIPSASIPSLSADVSKTQSKHRKRKASSKSGSPVRIDKLRFRNRRRDGGSPPPKLVENLTCRTSSTYRQKRGLPQGPPTDHDGDRREDGKINTGEEEDVVQWILTTSIFEFLNNMTAFAAVDMVDRFLSARIVSKKEADYLVVAALHIAVKYYQSQVYQTPSLDTLIGYVFEDDPNRLHRDRARIMEKLILNELGWKINVPTVYTYFVQFIERAEKRVDATTVNMGIFYAKLGLWSCHLVGMMLPPQMLAAAALEAACAYTGHKYQGSIGFKRKQLFDFSSRMLILHVVGTDCLHFCWWIPFNN